MNGYNRTLLIGNLTRDVEIKQIPSGSMVANTGIAVNRKYKSGEEWKEDVTFVNLVIWGTQGENCAKYLKKGSAVFIEGRLQSRSWETSDGQKRFVLEVVADRVKFLDKKPPDGEGSVPPITTSGVEEDIPF